MRPVLHSDVTTAVRAVLARPQPMRAAFCARLLQEADWADRFVRRLGKTHPFWGNGTLMGAARAHPLAAEQTFDSPEYCTVFELVVRQLAARKTAKVL